MQQTENSPKNKGIMSALWEEYGPAIEFIGGAGIVYTNVFGLKDATIELEKQALLYASQLLETPEIYMIPVMFGDDGLLTAGAMTIGAATTVLIGTAINNYAQKK